MTHPAWLEINKSKFLQNIAQVRNRTKTKICLPVKANAYGHGMIAIAKIAEPEVDCLGVSCCKEGVQLRQSGIKCPIIVFGAIHETQIDELLFYDLEISISSRLKYEWISTYCRKNQKRCRIHVEIDTGMQRTGMRSETALALLGDLEKDPSIEIVGIYSHLATSETPDNPFALRQIELFSSIQDRVGKKGVLWHLAASGGICYYPSSYFDMVRPGALCYGMALGVLDDFEILPILSLKAKVSYFKVVAPDQGISYGHLYKSKNQTRIITIPVGYGDGYPRSLSNEGCVVIRDQRFPIAGRVCMDQFMVDIGDKQAFVGDEVSLIGDKISLIELAKLANTDPRDITCRFTERLPRIYV